ncbi:MAG: TIM barrel protein, partial [bacterium]|nr:TIM barrel protein [bacterium]
MHNGRLSDTAKGCLRLIDGVDRSNFRMNFQPMYHDTPEEMMETLRQVATYVTTVHAQNYMATGSNERALIEQGLVDYRAVVEELKQVGFDGDLEVEFVKEDSETALKADAAFLRTLC